MKKLLFLLLVGMISFNLQAQTHERTINVNGEAIIKVVPEQVNFTIPLNIIDSSYLGCSNSLSQTLNELQADLLTKGISEEKVHTAHFTISENMVYEDGKRVQKGYKGSVTVLVSDTYRKEFIHEVLESVGKLELSYVIDFSLTSEQKDTLRELAIRKAVEDAKQKATILAEASEVHLGEVSLIAYGDRTFMPGPLTPQRMEMTKADLQGSNELNLNPPLISLTKSVNIVWQIE